jgi:uncharacterized phiE125 gp8 family phage protein
MVRLITPPVNKPVSLAEAKDHLRIIGTSEDTYISALIGAATDVAEKITGRQLEPATYDLFLNEFPATGPISIPLPPLQSVQFVSFTDVDGVEKTVSAFETDTVNGRVSPAYGENWPTARDVPNAVRVRFTAGYPTGATPAAIRAAILLLCGALYENREAYHTAAKLHENPAVNLLLFPFRVWR